MDLGDIDASHEMEFTTDVHAGSSLAIVTILPEQLPKELVLNAEELPCDEQGNVCWEKMMDDVYRNNRDYSVWVDWNGMG